MYLNNTDRLVFVINGVFSEAAIEFKYILGLQEGGGGALKVFHLFLFKFHGN
jgi:hypothetical protein